MKLYLIKRKADGHFLRNLETHYSLHVGQDKTAWSAKPSMLLRTPEGVAMNLRKLCSEAYYEDFRPKAFSREIAWRNFKPDELKLYEIVCMDVDVISMKSTPANEFIQLDAVENIPLTRKERQAG